MSSLATSLIVFAIILGGIFVGASLRNSLPKQHLEDDAKDVVRLGTGLIATIAGLVLSLLIASAAGSYNIQAGQVKHLTANVILLDELLAQDGPKARPARELLRRTIDPLIERIWRPEESEPGTRAPFAASSAAVQAFRAIEMIGADGDLQQEVKASVLDVVKDLAQTRLLLFEQAESAIPFPFLMVLVLWLAIIFASFSLFARLNPTVLVALSVFALSASGAIFLILELNRPFTGLMQISSEPLRHALGPL